MRYCGVFLEDLQSRIHLEVIRCDLALLVKGLGSDRNPGSIEEDYQESHLPKKLA